MSKRKPKPASIQVYTVMDELMASPIQPLAVWQRDHHLNIILKSFKLLEKGESPALSDAANVSDAANMLNTLVSMRFNQRGEEFEAIEFSSQTLNDAIQAIARCVIRGRVQGIYRFDAVGLMAVREVITFYTDLIHVIPARVFIKAHRKTKKEIENAKAGRSKAANIELIEV